MELASKEGEREEHALSLIEKAVFLSPGSLEFRKDLDNIEKSLK